MRTARQITVFLIFVVGIIVVLSLLFGRRNGVNKTIQSQLDLLSYVDKESRVIATTDGPINGDDAHRAVRITVDKDSRTIDVIQGYQGTVVATKSYPNNQAAYREFLNALNRASFGKSRKSSFTSEEGICATGRRFIFEVTEGAKTVSRTWGANCAKGNSVAVPSKITNLFRRQITDYEEVVEGHSI